MDLVIASENSKHRHLTNSQMLLSRMHCLHEVSCASLTLGKAVPLAFAAPGMVARDDSMQFTEREACMEV